MIAKLSSRQFKIILSLFIFSCLLVIFTSSNQPNNFDSSAEFQVKGTKIFDPRGEEFIAHGINVNGPGYGWYGDTPGAVEDIVERWKFNAIRLNLRGIEPKELIEENGTTEQIVDLYTDRGLVVVLSAFEQTGDYFTGEELVQLEQWWREQAQKYKDNPYVWFNVSNEPGGFDSQKPENVAKWIEQNQTVIDAIREAAADNIIVVDAHFWGQDVGEWNSDPVKQEKSSILSHSGKLDDPENNLVFSVHLYDQWQYGEAKMRDYFDRVEAAGIPLIIGEYGSEIDGSYQNTVTSALKLATEKGIGSFAWAWGGQDEFDLVSSGDGRGLNSQYDRDGNITNLTWFGERVLARNLAAVDKSDPEIFNPQLPIINKIIHIISNFLVTLQF